MVARPLGRALVLADRLAVREPDTANRTSHVSGVEPAGELLLRGADDREGVLEVSSLAFGQVSGYEVVVGADPSTSLADLMVQTSIGHQLQSIQEIHRGALV